MTGLPLLVRKGSRVSYHYVRSLREQSMFKVAFTVVFTVSCMMGLFLLFYHGFRFLDGLGGVGLLVIRQLFSLFFFGLGSILVMSSGISAYSTIYQSKEIPYLLLRPFRLGDIILYKYLEAALLSSWAFFVVIVPYVAAYAHYEELSAWFSVWTLVYSIPFVLLCAVFGTVLCIVLIRILPRGRTLMMLIALLITIILAVTGHGVHVATQGHSSNNVLLLKKLIPGFQLAAHPLWPSYWVAEGIMSMSQQRWGRGLCFLLLLLSYVGVGMMLVRNVGVRLFYDGWQRVIGSGRKALAESWMLVGLHRLLRFLPHDFRAMFFKDLRVFFRDPAQWTQGLIFFGILGFYFVNLRNLQYHTLPDAFRNVIAFLNIFSVSAVMCAVGARFVYPQLSLEGQGFWIVGMAPTSMKRVLTAKFLTASVIMLVISAGLMIVSMQMLQMEPRVKMVALCIAGAMSFGLSGLATGLGGIYMDLKQRNPAAIISSFGGTLNLVLSLLFVLCVILPYAIVFHLNLKEGGHATWFPVGVMCASGCMVLLTMLATIIPLGIGRASLDRRDY